MDSRHLPNATQQMQIPFLNDEQAKQKIGAHYERSKWAKTGRKEEGVIICQPRFNIRNRVSVCLAEISGYCIQFISVNQEVIKAPK